MPSILLNPVNKRTPSTFPNLKLLALPQHNSVKVSFKLNTIAANAWGYIELQVKCFDEGTYLGYVTAAYQRLYGLENDNRWVAPFGSLEPKYTYELWGRLRSKKAIPELMQLDCAIASTLDIPLCGGGDPDLPFFKVPPGMVIPYAGATVPDGYLMANGDVISRADYSDLFGAIGTIYGAGDGISTFRLPELRGEFVRGWDDGRGVDSGRAMGSSQEATRHPYIFFANNFLLAPRSYQPQYPDGVGSSVARSYPTASTHEGTNPQFYTSRPQNTALMWCIKF